MVFTLEKEIVDKSKCPLIKGNPSICPFAERVAVMETDVKWLKKGYWIQIAIGGATLLGIVLDHFLF